MNIRPLPEHAWVEVRCADRLVRLGQMDESGLIDRIHAAEAALDSLIRLGLFAREQATTFAFLYHFDSVAAWLAYMSERWTSAVIDEAIIADARELLAPGAGELLVREQVYAARLSRAAPG